MSKKINDYKEKASKTFEKVMDTEDKSSSYSKKEISNGKGMSMLSYVIPLIPYFLEKENKFVRYHAKQGMDLLLVAILYSIVYNILTSVIRVNGSCGSLFGYNLGNYCRITPWWVTYPLGIIGLCISIIAIMGIINASKGKAKDLPLINKLKIFNK